MFEVHYNSTTSLLLLFKQEISNEINAEVLAMQERIQKAIKENEIYGIEEIVSAYASLLIYFDPCKLSLERLSIFLEHIKHEKIFLNTQPSLCLELPLCYDEEFGLDLQSVCMHTKCSKEELISLHTKPFYRVFMLGFMAGFAYLGGLDKRLFTPRLSSPRLKIEAGSVGIADKQTGIYPISSPGGWQIIARSPLKFFDKENETDPTLLKAGMFLKFKAIDRAEFDDIKQRLERNAYERVVYEYKDS
ncbi:allophanate hydrolase [Campylobacter sp. MIT 99-7217]|uniref:5-oxoprolinase subunit PxpB n=1 Tax=Campylobacter sp. MIT 99-7217 TaxID=535091 RepID=UPI0011571566|nr:5-oxoprolinase subunit PxpB [Campylobacter sp. MIT 99-7217]TQR33797.1 allophanate hydrolase [Campylobacter sp. MIT 99-7217]